jgi:peptide/nickel transport system permease protein
MSSLAPGYERRTTSTWWLTIRSNPLGLPAVLVLLGIVAISAFAPYIAEHNPTAIAPALRLRSPGDGFLLGTDALGRDIFARLVYGGRVSLLIGLGAAASGIGSGLLLGLVAGYFRRADAVIMRAMDGIMAIPNVLLAIAVVALWGGSIAAVLIAITIPEIPRVTRLVRSVVLSTREEPYVEAAVALGTPGTRIMWRHLMPNTIGPLLVQGTYICAAAILLESILSFLGAGINPEIPTWGNMMADGRLYFQLRPSMILWPALLLSLTILSINIIGDAVRDWLDPRAAGRGDMAQ